MARRFGSAARRLRRAGDRPRPRQARDHPAAARHDGRVCVAARLLPHGAGGRTPTDRRRSDRRRSGLRCTRSSATRRAATRTRRTTSGRSLLVVAAIVRRAAPRRASRDRSVRQAAFFGVVSGDPFRSLRVSCQADARGAPRRRCVARRSRTGSSTRWRHRHRRVRLQQVSLSEGFLATSVATVSVANPSSRLSSALCSSTSG